MSWADDIEEEMAIDSAEHWIALAKARRLSLDHLRFEVARPTLRTSDFKDEAEIITQKQSRQVSGNGAK